jgi:peptidoglycan/xylan/chitin deacetylase (PgdA/CDA1 family)
MNTDALGPSSPTLKSVVKNYAYATLWPAARLLGRRVYPPPRASEIALTFDDGPNPACTPRLLDLLASNNVRASFFLVGRFAQAEPVLVRRISAEGHVIGNHTWSHPNLAHIPAAHVLQELKQTSDALEQVTGKPIRLFRPPFGAANRTALATARGLGMVPVFWNAMTADWESRPAAQIADELKQQITRNEGRKRATCLVLHDRKADAPDACCDASVDAAARLIVQYQGRSQFVTIDSWL